MDDGLLFNKNVFISQMKTTQFTFLIKISNF